MTEQKDRSAFGDVRLKVSAQDDTKHTRLEREIAVTRDPLEDVLREAWRIVTRDLQVSLELPQDVYAALVDSPMLEFYGPRTDRAAGSGPGLDRHEGEERWENLPVVLSGSVPEIRLQFRRLARSISDEKAARQFVTTIVRETLVNLERSGTTHEAIADSLLLVVDGLPGSSLSFMEVCAPYLRGYVEAERRFDADWYKTVGALGNAVRLSGLHDGLFGVSYYEEALEEIARQWRMSPPPRADVPADLWEVIEANANNIATRIARKLQPRTQKQQARMKASPVVMDCNRLSAACRLTRNFTGQQELALSVFDSRLASDGPAQRFTWELLDSIQGSLSCIPDPYAIYVAYLEALGGVARGALQLAERTAAAFFNAGVSLASIGKAALQRAALNALGAYWALALSPNDVRFAMQNGDGLDCLVNFFGSLADARPISDNLRSAAHDVATLTFDVLEGATWITALDPDRERLTGSWQNLGFVVGPVTNQLVGTDVLIKALETLLSTLASSLGLDRSSGNRTEGDLAIVHACFAQLLEHNVQELVALRTRAADLLRSRADDASRPVEILTNDYAAMLETGGPVVTAGLVTREDWGARRQEMVKECRSISEAIDAGAVAYVPR